MKIIHTSKKPLIVGAIIAVFVIGGVSAYALYAHAHMIWPYTRQAPMSSTQMSNNNDTTTSQDDTDAAKSALSDKESSKDAGTTAGPTQPTNANVFVTDAAQYGDSIEVRSYTDTYENGTCTITFTHGSLTVKKSTPAYTDAKTTICTNPLFSRSEFSEPGTWSVVVTYVSASGKAAGSSTAMQVNIT